MDISMAFGITEEDICTVLLKNVSQVANSDGKSFEDMADAIFNNWCGGVEFDRIAGAALDGGTEMNDQTEAAHAEIREILLEQGVLKR